MDANVKSVIDARKVALDMYTDPSIINKREELFKSIYELGENSVDVPDFETKFASSPLNTDYINLITEAATMQASELNVYTPSLEDIAKQEVKSQIDSAIRSTPIGDAMQVKQNLDMLKKIANKE